MNESTLGRISNVVGAVAIVLLICGVVQPLVSSQTAGTLPSDLSQTILVIRRAESAGATLSELSGLMVLLNNALELDREAAGLSPQDSGRRDQLLAQAGQILISVQDKAGQLEVVASQRTYADTLLTYVGGIVAAAIGTIVYGFAVSFYRKARIERTFKMRISRK